MSTGKHFQYIFLKDTGALDIMWYYKHMAVHIAKVYPKVILELISNLISNVYSFIHTKSTCIYFELSSYGKEAPGTGVLNIPYPFNLLEKYRLDFGKYHQNLYRKSQLSFQKHFCKYHYNLYPVISKYPSRTSSVHCIHKVTFNPLQIIHIS